MCQGWGAVQVWGSSLVDSFFSSIVDRLQPVNGGWGQVSCTCLDRTPHPRLLRARPRVGLMRANLQNPDVKHDAVDAHGLHTVIARLQRAHMHCYAHRLG